MHRTHSLNWELTKPSKLEMLNTGLHIKYFFLLRVSDTWLPTAAPHPGFPFHLSTENSPAWPCSKECTGLHRATGTPRRKHSYSTFVFCIQQLLDKIQLLLFRTLTSSWVLQKGHWTLCASSFFQVSTSRFHSGFEIQFWGCTLSFIIRQLVLFCRMFAVCNAAFHPYHVLDRCTAHDVGIDGISLRAIFMEVTQMSLTVHIVQCTTPFLWFLLWIQGYSIF